MIEAKIGCWRVAVGSLKLQQGLWKNLCEEAWGVRGEL